MSEWAFGLKMDASSHSSTQYRTYPLAKQLAGLLDVRVRGYPTSTTD